MLPHTHTMSSSQGEKLSEGIKKLSLADLVKQQQEKSKAPSTDAPKKEDQESGGEEATTTTPQDLEASPDVHFEPIVHLEQVAVKSNEEQEEIFFTSRAKLFRFDKLEGAGEWKERGTGELKLLQHKETKKIRLLMRRDQTLKICANHLVSEDLKLAPHAGSDKAWVYTTLADVSEGAPRAELLAVRFGKPETAKEFQEKFEKAKAINAQGDDDGQGEAPEAKAKTDAEPASEKGQDEASLSKGEAAKDAAKPEATESTEPAKDAPASTVDN